VRHHDVPTMGYALLSLRAARHSFSWPASAPIHLHDGLFICRKIRVRSRVPGVHTRMLPGVWEPEIELELEKRRLELKFHRSRSFYDKFLVSPIHLACQSVTCSYLHNPDKYFLTRSMPGFTSPISPPITRHSLRC